MAEPKEQNTNEYILRVRGESENLGSLDSHLKTLIGSAGRAGKALSDTSESVQDLDKAAKSKSVVRLGRDLNRMAAGAKNLFGQMGSLVKSVASLAGASVGFKESIKVVEDYSSSILKLSSQFNKYGKSITEVEKQVVSFSKNLNLTRESVVKLMSSYEKLFPLASLRSAEKIFKNIKNIFGANVEEIKGMSGFLGKMISKVPEMQGAAENLTEANKERLRSYSEMLLITGQISLAEQKRLQDYLNQNKQMSKQDLERQERAKRYQDTIKDMKRIWQDVAIVIGEAIMPYIKSLADWLKKNEQTVKNIAGFLAKWVPPLLIASKVFKLGRSGLGAVKTVGSFGGRALSKMAAGGSGRGLIGQAGRLAPRLAKGAKLATAGGAIALGGEVLFGGLGSMASTKKGKAAAGVGKSASRIAGGALTGAAIGSIVPGLGTAIGGIIGGLLSFVADFKNISKNIQTLFGDNKALMGILDFAKSAVGKVKDFLGLFDGPGWVKLGKGLTEASNWVNKWLGKIGEGFLQFTTLGIYGKVKAYWEKRGEEAIKAAKEQARKEAKIRKEIEKQRQEYAKREKEREKAREAINTGRAGKMRRSLLSGETTEQDLERDKRVAKSLRDAGLIKEAEAMETNIAEALSAQRTLREAIAKSAESQVQYTKEQMNLIVKIGSGLGTFKKEQNDALTRLETSLNKEERALKDLQDRRKRLINSTKEQVKNEVVAYAKARGRKATEEEINEAIAKELSVSSALEKANDNISKQKSKIVKKTQSVVDLLRINLDLAIKRAEIQGKLTAGYSNIVQSSVELAKATGRIDLQKMAEDITDTVSQTNREIKSLKKARREAILLRNTIDLVTKGVHLGNKQSEIFTKFQKKAVDKLVKQGKTIKEALAIFNQQVKSGELFNSVQGEVLNKTAEINKKEVERRNTYLAMGEQYEGRLEKASAESSLLSGLVQLQDNLVVGLGASVQARKQAAEAVGRELSIVEEQIKANKEAFRVAKINEESEETLLKLQTQRTQYHNKKVSLLQKEASILKEIRDGWVSAINAQTIGTGRIAKLQLTAQKGMRQALQYHNAIRSATSGAVSRAGEGSLGFRSSERFKPTSGGGLVIERGRAEGSAYKTDVGEDQSKMNKRLRDAREDAREAAKEASGGKTIKGRGGSALGAKGAGPGTEAVTAPTKGAGKSGIVGPEGKMRKGSGGAVMPVTVPVPTSESTDRSSKTPIDKNKNCLILQLGPFNVSSANEIIPIIRRELDKKLQSEQFPRA